MGTEDGMQSQNHADYSSDLDFRALTMLLFLQFILYFNLHHKSLAGLAPFLLIHFYFLYYFNAGYFSDDDDAQLLNSLLLRNGDYDDGGDDFLSLRLQLSCLNISQLTKLTMPKLFNISYL